YAIHIRATMPRPTRAGLLIPATGSVLSAAGRAVTRQKPRTHADTTTSRVNMRALPCYVSKGYHTDIIGATDPPVFRVPSAVSLQVRPVRQESDPGDG